MNPELPDIGDPDEILGPVLEVLFASLLDTKGQVDVSHFIEDARSLVGEEHFQEFCRRARRVEHAYRELQERAGVYPVVGG